jgi:hypothetical protein
MAPSNCALQSSRVRPLVASPNVLLTLGRLPGSPMWLIALYVHGFAGINKYWIPPLWYVATVPTGRRILTEL